MSPGDGLEKGLDPAICHRSVTAIEWLQLRIYYLGGIKPETYKDSGLEESDYLQ